MRLGAILLFAAVAAPAVAQDLPEITAEETAAAVAAVEAAGLSDAAYRNLWCAGSYALLNARQVTAAEPGEAQQSATVRDAFYRKAASELFAAGLTETEFTAIAENVYRVALSQERTAVAAARDFTEGECAAAAASP
jgi:hypothetical protein